MNVLLLLLDALRFDHVTPEITPNLCRISREGVFFTNSYSCNSSTLHSMPCILCGKKEYDPDVNIASVLGRHGVHTAAIHSNPMIHNFYPGFRETIDLKSKKFRMSKSWRKTLRATLPPSILAGMKRLRANVYDEEQYLPYSRADETLEFTAKWIKEHDRYLLWVHLMEPHIPYYPKETSLGLSRIEMRTLNDKFVEAAHGRYQPTSEEVEQARTLYREEVHEMDVEVGKFVDGFPEGDLIIVTSDHGEEFGEDGQFTHHTDKFTPTLTHVPLIMRGGGVRRGAVLPDYVSNLSVSPTILSAMGVADRIGEGGSLWGMVKA
jgi:arylsulfatase A-like enzyme